MVMVAFVVMSLINLIYNNELWGNEFVIIELLWKMYLTVIKKKVLNGNFVFCEIQYA